MQIDPCEQKLFYEKNRFVSQKSRKNEIFEAKYCENIGKYFNGGYVVMTAL